MIICGWSGDSSDGIRKASGDGINETAENETEEWRNTYIVYKAVLSALRYSVWEGQGENSLIFRLPLIWKFPNRVRSGG